MMNVFDFYKAVDESKENRDNFLLTILDGENAGGRYLFCDKNLVMQLSGCDLTEDDKREAAEFGKTGILLGENNRFFCEFLSRPSRLIICGGGHVSQQVVPLARKVGFSVTVLEDRPSFADEARRAGADKVICDNFSDALSVINGGEDAYFLVVTRGHRYDRVCLELILNKSYRYVGMMASRGRSSLLKKEMEADGINRELLDSIHTPVGLSIKAETPEEIAVSIVAELILTKNSDHRANGYDKELMEYLRGEKEPEIPKALATIISRRGSAPRGIGTKMLVLADGRIVGTIGGGCMESEVQHLCLRFINEGKKEKRIYTVDMTASQAEEEGLVCGGTIEVFLEVL